MKKKRILRFLAIIIAIIVVMIVGLFINSETLHKSEKGLTESKLKIGFIIDGNKDDSNLNISAYNGIMNVKDETEAYFSIRENISADNLEITSKTYAEDDFNVLILAGANYDDIAKNLAEEFPDIKFIVLNSNLSNGKNLGSLYMDYRSSGFVKGMLASYVSQNNVITGIGYNNDNATVHELYGFEQGVHYVNPDIQVYSEYVTKRGGDASVVSLLNEFMGYGADVVLSAAGNRDSEVFDLAEEKNIYAFANSISFLESYPETVVAVTGFEVSVGVADIIKMIYVNAFNGESIALDFDIIYKEELKGEISERGLNRVEDVLNKLKSGELDINKLAPLE